MMLQAVCLIVFLLISMLQCQVLDFTRQLTPADVYCGHLRCVANSSLTIINMAIYALTEKEMPVKLASMSVFATDVSVDPSKIHDINATGTISKYAGVLDIRFLRDVDCWYGTFQCELDFVKINGQPDVIRENLAPATQENATILYTLAKIASQLKEHSQEMDKQLEALKNDNEVLKNDTQVLKHDNEAVNTALGSFSVELSKIKELLNSILDKNQLLGSFCYLSMPHKSPREKFVLQGNVLALCDTETDGGGWVVIQRRTRGDVDFYRGWEDYKRGFGAPDTDFWIGNDIIHDLTSQGYNELRIDFVYNKTELFAQYTNFTLANESSEYIITIDGYSGNYFDFMIYHNGSKFSTFDRESGYCAVPYHGAWWYKNCYTANLNGNWAATNSSGFSLHSFDTGRYSTLSFTEMKIRLWFDLEHGLVKQILETHYILSYFRVTTNSGLTLYSMKQYFTQYTNFTLADESSAYVITVDGLSGNVYDSINYHSGSEFITFDRDNDIPDANCAVLSHGAY